MRYLFSLLFLLAYGSTVAQQPPMLPRDAAIEAKIEKLLEQMSLDEKIGQMVELEIGMITYRDPRYVVEACPDVGAGTCRHLTPLWARQAAQCSPVGTDNARR